jgi:hypothetical protein
MRPYCEEVKMTQKSVVRKGLPCAAMILPAAGALVLFAMSPYGIAQDSAGAPAASQGAAGVSGTVIVPPASDPGIVRQAPSGGDPQAVKPPPMPIEPDAVRKAPATKETERKKAVRPELKPKAAPDNGHDQNRSPALRGETGQSTKDACKGGTELCRQDSAR